MSHESKVVGQVKLSAETMHEITEHPLRLLPPAVRSPVLGLWTCYRHLAGLESALSLCALMAHWLVTRDLAEEDVVIVCQRMLSPSRVARVRYASDLTSGLALEVMEVWRQRRIREEAKRRREEMGREAEDETLQEDE